MRRSIPAALLFAALTIASAFDAPGQTEIYRVVSGFDRTWSTVGVGDTNFDGYGDFASIDSNHTVLLFSGRDGSILFTWTSNLFGNWGDIVSRVGDANGDGAMDVAVGNRDDNALGPFGGSITVFSGLTGSILWRVVGPAQASVGQFLDAMGDVNGDGLSDILTTAQQYTPNGGYWGFALVLSGANGATLRVIQDPVLRMGGPPSAVATGDMNGDSIPDLVMNSPIPPLAQPGVQPGTTHVARGYSGANGSVLFTINGESATDVFTVLAGGGDIDGDGRGDFLGVAAGSTFPNGRVRVFSGATAQLIMPPLNGNAIQQITGWWKILGDINGDGRAEFTYRQANITNFFHPAFPIHSGLDGSVLATLSLAPRRSRRQDPLPASVSEGTSFRTTARNSWSELPNPTFRRSAAI